MSARRQSSTTSLSRYARASSPVTNPSIMDFCNCFWGPQDAGVDVLFARMRGAIRTVDELRTYWKERYAIEEEYAKRLLKLSKMPLGRDEIGDLRNSLDTIKLETDRQAGFHRQLAEQIRTDLEGNTNIFYEREMDFKKKFQSAVEKEYKTKQTQESYVLKARDKYEQDCMRINSYTAQSTLVQGKDYDKLQMKLDRVRQTVGANEHDFANFAKAYVETAERWEMVWVDYCDKAQDLEEDRIDFIKDNLWVYANAVSSVCVLDDESCEKIRVVLEQMDVDREQENFVRDYGTGNQIPDPPKFVNYNSPDAIPSSSSKPHFHAAHFVHANDSMRIKREYEKQRDLGQQPPLEEPTTNAAGIGAGGGQKRDPEPESAQLTRQPSRKPIAPPPQPQQPPVNGHHPSISNLSGSASRSHSIPRKPVSPAIEPATGSASASPPKAFKTPHDPLADPIHPTAETYIKVGANAYPVDLSRDPQSQSSATSPSKQSAISSPGGFDPLAKQLEELQSQVSSAGSIRRSSTRRQPNGQGGSVDLRGRSNRSSALGMSADSQLQAPRSNAASPTTGRGPSPNRDYRNSAEMVVGAHPLASRSTSPQPNMQNPPTAAFMQAPRSVSPGAEVIEGVLTDYHQSLPGERKSISRRGSYVGPQPNVAPGASTENLARPPSIGHAGIGAHGRSRSTSPQPTSRAPSPSFMSPPAQSPQRATSPNSVGIALDPSGRVLHDDMAQRYQQQPSHHQPAYQPPPPQQQRPPTGPPPQQQPQMVPPPPPQGYGMQQPSYGAPPPSVIQPPPPPPQQQPPPPPPQQQQPAYGMHVQTPSYQSPAYYQAAPPQQQYPNGYDPYYGTPRQMNGYQQQPQHQQQQSGRTPSPARAPAMPPTGQTLDDGSGILFYVQALYDYRATIDEEFDFQAGDVIAVTSTPEDGWWSGQLLDENRRIPGRHVFPSNFVTLF